MSEEIKKIVLEIQKNYREGYGLKEDDQIFYHLLNQIEKHIKKLINLKKFGEDIPGRFKREIADMYLLAKGLVELEGVDEEIIKTSGKYYLDKVKENSKK